MYVCVIHVYVCVVCVRGKHRELVRFFKADVILKELKADSNILVDEEMVLVEELIKDFYRYSTLLPCFAPCQPGEEFQTLFMFPISRHW